MHKKFSKLGYILAMAGSAIGLGNAWKFPTMTGNHGGFAFIFLYFVLTILIACVAFLAEAGIGRLSGKDTPKALIELAPKGQRFWGLGGFFMITALLIASFYLVVIGWILYYAYLSIGGLPASTDEASNLFDSLIKNNLTSVLSCYFAVLFITFYTVSRGIKEGIEKLNFILMPSLFILLIVILIYSFTFNSSGFSGAVSFIFTPDFSKILDPELILAAMGLALFSLSLGVGTVSTYGASLGEDTNLFKSLLYIVGLNICMGILMGLVVFSFVQVAPGASANEGPGLIFVSLASLFGELGVVGSALGFMFFISLLFAGITSAVSMIEPAVRYFEDEKGISRIKSSAILGILVFGLGVLCVLSFYEPTKESFAIFGKSIFDILDYATSNVLMPLGVLFFSIFAGWIMPKERFYTLFLNYAPKFAVDIWYFILRFILPILVVGIGIYRLN
ncbi:sodium-dependent transporter [Campylobacter sp. 50012-21]|uniref:sodium-dependent transporter n=1 Tax=Campylobacter magnus TaxID=3026462 RepID=UPI0023605C2F|nr:sodium-dependent transporter [Campylobacter magnus]MDD0846313.1 sodium-dependent transporter [Campylobacter magnus]